MTNLTATQYHSVKDKEKFIRQFKRFVERGYRREDFPKWFYQDLSDTFGHIAHYNQDGFYETFFVDEEGRRRFMHLTMTYPCYGNPAFTYSDAEREIQSWLFVEGHAEKAVREFDTAVERKERALLEHLQAKYQGR